MERELVHIALDKLETHTGIHGEWIENGEPEIDGRIQLELDAGPVKCYIEVKKEIRKHHLRHLQYLAEEYQPFMLIVGRLYPKLKEELRQRNIFWLDGAGNIYFKNRGQFIWIDRHKTTPPTQKKHRAFTKTGLKVVYLFLKDEKWLNKTYREIAEGADVALGNIKLVLDGLKDQNFLIKKDKKNYQLVQKEELLEQWITAFTDELKPRLHVGNFRFLNTEDMQNWKQLNLEEGTFWGGEPGAEYLTGMLKPGAFIMYTPKTKAALMKDYRLIPDPEGNVEVYRPYWKIETEHPKAAPALTVYADLMITGDPRNMNIAQEIYEQFLQD